MPALTNHIRSQIGRDFALWSALPLGIGAAILCASPYVGIWHDGYLYAAQAVRRMAPGLDGDLYFRFDNQDDYTLFSPLYAWMTGAMGLETAAHVLARGSGLAFLGGALSLARRLLPRDQAWLALTLLVLIPGWYGASEVFSYNETIPAPRVLAQALVLGSTLAVLGPRPAWSVAPIGVAVLLHPLMAVPGVLLAAALLLHDRPRAWYGALAAGLCVLAATALVACLRPVGPLTLVDAEWRSVIAERVPYLLLDQWSVLDWQQNAVPLVTLAVTAVLTAGLQRRAAVAALAVGAGGVLVHAFATYAAPVALLLQGQPWRWAWLSKAMAVLLLVPAFSAAWRSGNGGRACAALLGAAWLGIDEALALPAALLAFLVAFVSLRAPSVRWVAVAGFAAAALLAVLILRIYAPTPGRFAIVLAIGVWWALFRGTSACWRAAAVLTCAGLFGTQSVMAFERQRLPLLDARAQAAFEPWRKRIGVHQTVYWPRYYWGPWLLLQRRSYASMAGVIFSREAAMETRRRHRELHFYASAPWIGSGPSQREPYLTLPVLQRLCATGGIDFVVSPDSLPLPSLRMDAAGDWQGYRLYSCSDLAEQRP